MLSYQRTDPSHKSSTNRQERDAARKGLRDLYHTSTPFEWQRHSWWIYAEGCQVYLTDVLIKAMLIADLIP